MTAAYDIERVAIAAGTLTDAIAAAQRHEWPEWLTHRMATVAAEVSAFLDALRIYNPISPTHGAEGAMKNEDMKGEIG